MTVYRVGRNELCPCGSGKKYKRCCWDKGFQWVRSPTGQISRRVPIHPELRQALDDYLVAFRKEFGRDPRPDEPLLAGLTEEELKRDTIAMMKQAGIRPVLIYAYEKTGLMVTEMNKGLLPDTSLDEWDRAVAEYYEQHPEELAEYVEDERESDDRG